MRSSTPLAVGVLCSPYPSSKTVCVLVRLVSMRYDHPWIVKSPESLRPEEAATIRADVPVNVALLSRDE